MNHSLTTKDRILEQACLLFAKGGYDDVSTRQIAEAAHARHGSLRYHFESKEALYTAVFRKVYDLDNALTYDVLLKREPLILDTPDGKAYAIQRIVFDYFQRHVFIPDPWRWKLIHRELMSRTLLFCRLIENALKEESAKMVEFYFLLRPEGNPTEAFFWAHLPDTQGLYYFLSEEIIKDYFENCAEREAREELGKIMVKKTAKIMIAYLDLPVPPMLD